MTQQQQLEQHKYLILEQFAPIELLNVLSEYLWFRQQQKGGKYDQNKKAFHLSHEPVLDVVLDYFAIVFSAHIGAKLLPTYGFSRIYYQDADLPRHIDRPACEVSCTFPLGMSDTSDWPICVSVDEQDLAGRAINLSLGDMLLYKGEQLYHWREGSQKQWQAQLFLHYVYAEGENAQHQFDKRGGLLMSLERLGLVDNNQMTDEQIAQELQTGEIAAQLTGFLQKQLLVLKVIAIAKKSFLPFVIIGAIAVFTMN